MQRTLPFLLLLAALLAACPAKPPQLAPSPPVPSGLLGPGDVFEIRVYGEAELSGIHRVSPSGTIDVPLIGRVEVAAVTAPELATALTERFKQYVKNPNVSIFVKEYNSQKIYVFGEVQRPGTFRYEEGMNIVQAITLAGGFAKLADKNGTFVTRHADGVERRIEVAVEDIGEGRVPNLQLQPGDIVYVPEGLF